MNDEMKIIVLRLRHVIGFLGERMQFNWWPTGFFESSSRLFLEPVYTRTSALAQYHGVVEAARKLHDEHLNVGCYHLFRFPEEIEHSLHVWVSNKVEDDVIFHSLQSKENALASLKTMSGSNVAASEGPMLVGKIKDFESVKALETTAGAYFAAFEKSLKVFPYFMR
ncbi:MAG: BrxE family protein [Proteobacteria bacterium]|nr:BrxE family protein [Pseudomonadota bacterium]